ncbi:hypothetical protein AAFF_G00391540 [Aldrovandia affinis]|uniref:Uncharacterized protein n=1 Tax=Aldrovandia affinis TaxID=143900 RepID=A0AAD7WL74_9TELE|nr:hypothetical protein AAFF_G00391540 [Aldrovandia affinis]
MRKGRSPRATISCLNRWESFSPLRRLVAKIWKKSQSANSMLRWGFQSPGTHENVLSVLITEQAEDKHAWCRFAWGGIVVQPVGPLDLNLIPLQRGDPFRQAFLEEGDGVGAFCQLWKANQMEI